MSDSTVQRSSTFTPIGSAIGVASGWLGGLSSLAIVVMMMSTVWDVFARYFFNAPTIWATEVSTYLLIGAIFLAAAHTHLGGGHVRVDILLQALSPDRRHRLALVAAWIGFLYAALAGWQAVLLVASDYANGSRLFSLLLTPSWLPKLPIAIGLCVLAAAILFEIEQLAAPAQRWRAWFPYLVFGLVVTPALVAFGANAPTIAGTRFDFGSLLVLVGVYVCALASGGVKVLAGVLVFTVGGFAGLYLGSALGLGFVTAVLGVAIVLTLAVGIRIAFALGFVGTLAIYFVTPVPFPVTIADRAWSAVDSFSLTAVPLFVLMGAFLVRSGLSRELFSVMSHALARLPGGLAHAGTAGCAIFSAVSGSSVATAATIGTVACPEMMRRGYSPGLTFGSIAAGGTLGILIPPSVPLIIYGTTVGVPVVTLFVAGIVPGLLMVGCFFAVVLVWAMLDPRAAPRANGVQAEPLGRATVIDTGLLAVLIGVVIFSLYAGLATPSETGAVGAFLALVICVIRGRMSWAVLRESLTETTAVTSFIFLIVVGAGVLTFGFDYLKVSQALMSLAIAAEADRWTIVLIVLLVYLVLGMFLDSISMMVLTLPVIFPLIQSLGFDPVWFGIVLVIMAEIGLITPPVGMNLFVLQGISRDVSIRTIAVGTMPFMFAMLLTVALLSVFPEIALWLTRDTN